MIESSATRQKQQKGKYENNMKRRHIAVASIGLSVLSSLAAAEIVGHEKYAYDTTGNVVEKEIGGKLTRFYYKGNILQSDSLGTTYLHDDAGRLHGEVRSGQVDRKYSYQYGDKVILARSNGATTKFLYNAEGHLVGKTNEKGMEAFAWDGLGIVLSGSHSYAGENHLTGGVPAMRNGEVVVSDYLGTTLSVGKTGLEATVFGEGLEQGFFTGKPFIKELGSFVFKYRNYSPENLCWTSLDPSGFPDGPNGYLYVSNNPTLYFDKLGLSEHLMEATDSVYILCYDDSVSEVGVTSILKSTFSTSPSVHRSFVFSTPGASGSSPSSNVSANDPFVGSTETSCGGVHGEGFKYKNYTQGAVEGYVQVTVGEDQFGSSGISAPLSTKLVHGLPAEQ